MQEVRPNALGPIGRFCEGASMPKLNTSQEQLTYGLLQLRHLSYTMSEDQWDDFIAATRTIGEIIINITGWTKEKTANQLIVLMESEAARKRFFADYGIKHERTMIADANRSKQIRTGVKEYSVDKYMIRRYNI